MLKNYLENGDFRFIQQTMNNIDVAFEKAENLLSTDPVGAFKEAVRAESEFSTMANSGNLNLGNSNSVGKPIYSHAHDLKVKAYLQMGDDADKTLRGEFSLRAEPKTSLFDKVIDHMKGFVGPKLPDFTFTPMR